MTLIGRYLNHYAWIGLNDIKRSNYFMWMDNAEVTYTHWGGHQPDENTQSQDPADRVGPMVC